MMYFDEYANRVMNTKPAKPATIAIVGLGLCGEAGEAAEHIKKHLRDGRKLRGNEKFALELGDVLWYWLRAVKASGFTPEEIMYMNARKLEKRHAST